jgi:MscS family membrane protein
VEGTVEAIGLRSTRVRTLTRTLVTIPNGQMATMTLENFSARDSFLFRHTIGIAYDTSPGALSLLLEKVRVLLHDDARVVPASPRVRFLRFAASSLDIEVIAYARARDWPHFLEIQEELLIRIREVIESAGVEIAFPTQSLYLKNVLDPNTVTAEPFYQERTES